MDAQLRITLWPERTLKAPRVERTETARVDAEGWMHPEWSGPRPDPAPLPEELVLRELLEVDPTDTESVVGFVVDYGVFTQGADARLDHGTGVAEGPRLLHVNEAGLHVRYAQALVWHWVAHVDDERVMGAWERAGLADPGAEIGDRDVETDIAWSFFAEAMNRGLAAFPPYVEVVPAHAATRAVLPTYGEPTVDLFTGMCVQLFNLMAEDLPVLRCANETCDRRFVRQSGRAIKGLHRTEGVLYCSKGCARAQAQREYRRRKRSTP